MDLSADRLSLGRLKWLAIAVPIAAVALLELLVHLLYPELASWPGRLVLAGAVVMGLIFFYGLVFGVLGRMQDRLARQNRELLALHRAAIDIYGELSLEVVLQKVVDQVRRLLDARYGAVAVLDSGGAIREFVTSGMAPEARHRIGEPPRGSGLFGVVLSEGDHLRLDDISSDPRFSGFPPNHPPMRSLLAVPVVCKGPFRGNLYVADKEGEAGFSAADEEALSRFASVSAIAIDNTYLHQQLRNLAVLEERELLAREMHDGLAQVLAYVNTKAQAVERLLDKERSAEARRQLAQLAAAAREVYTDVREGILALRSQLRRDSTFAEALRGFVESWKDQAEMPVRLDVADDLTVPAHIELQLMRIIQEALSNVRKHAHASGVDVEVAHRGGRLVARVADDGGGFDTAARGAGGRPRFGLAIMRERAESIGGTLSIESSPGGTTLRVELNQTE